MPFQNTTQARFWMFSEVKLDALRRAGADLAVKKLPSAGAGTSEAAPLQPHDERMLRYFYETKLQEVCREENAQDPTRFTDRVMFAALMYFKRFFLRVSLMEEDPKHVMLAALLVAVGNGGVTNRLDAPLQPHLKGYGPHCQMMIYMRTFFGNRHSALLSSIQADVSLYLHDQDRWLHSSRRGEAAIDYSLLERAIDAGYPCVEAYLRDRRNSTDVTTLRCVREYRAGANAWDEDYEEPAAALLGEHRAYVAELDALTAAGQFSTAVARWSEGSA